MSIKSLFQILIIFLIIFIIGSVYFKYFDDKKNIVEETKLLENDNLNQIQELEKKILDLEIKNQELSKKILNNNKKSNLIPEKIELEDQSENTNKTNKDVNDNKKKLETNKDVNDNKKKLETNKDLNDNKKKLETNKDLKDNKKKLETNKNKKNKTVFKNFVKDVEYTSVDEKGNRFYLLASSGRSNENNKDILDLDNVRGKITSDNRDTIYIVSDYAQYDTVNLNSKFYENVIINYQDKKIDCLNFDINMDKNKAIAYNNVIISDPKSIMKAGIVEFDLKTKDIFINPDKIIEDVKVITN